MQINAFIKNTFRKFGLEVHRFNPTISPTAQIIASMQKFKIDLVLDVGANQGQFATEIRSGGYSKKIVSFEPLLSAHNALLRVSNADSQWDVFSRCALGNYNGDVEINIAGNSVSSSILPMMESHLSAAPESAYQGKEVVSIKTLDTVAGQYLKNSYAPFLKIDTQGFEWQVLDGAQNVLPTIRGGVA